MTCIQTGKDEETQAWGVERVQSGSRGAAQGGCKIFHQLRRLGSEYLVLGLVLPALPGITLTLWCLGGGRMGGSQAKVHLGLEARGGSPGSSWLPTF